MHILFFSYVISIISFKDSLENLIKDQRMSSFVIINFINSACLRVLNFIVIGQYTINTFLKFFRCSWFSEFDGNIPYIFCYVGRIKWQLIADVESGHVIISAFREICARRFVRRGNCCHWHTL